MGSPEPVKIHERAADNLRYIRDTMERAGTFTAVPGWGGIGMGVLALLTGFLARGGGVMDDDGVRYWLITASIAFVVGAVAMGIKAQRGKTPLFTGVGRKFMFAYIPPVAAGAVLTLALWRAESFALLPACWLLLYGAGVTAAGVTSIRLIPIMGVCFMLLGAAAAAMPQYGNLLMTAGFGGLQIIFGVIIAWRHGG